MLVRHALPMTDVERQLTRRRLLELGLVLPPLAVIAGRTDLFSSPALAATPAVLDADDDPTPELTEGPYFTPNSPKRKSILPSGAVGTRLTLTGRVLTTGRADPERADRLLAGRRPRRLRQQRLSLPRPPVHEREGAVLAPHRRPRPLPRPHKAHPREGAGAARAVLTTQLFFPGVARNGSDGIYTSECLVKRWRFVQGRRVAAFDFVLDV